MGKKVAKIIYKICSQTAWLQAQQAKIYIGSSDDLRDGFIHFSTAAQLRTTVDKHFSGQRNLVLLAVNGGKLGQNLKWEPSRDGALFPHLYGKMPVSAVSETWDIEMDRMGKHLLPEGLV